MTENDRERTIPADDVDDVVGVASELEHAEQRRVRVAEMEDIAEDLRIDPKYVAPAIETLERRRAQALEERTAQLARRRTWIARGAIALAATGVLLIGGAGWTRSALAPRWSEVERARSQVENVIDRRERVEAIWRARPSGLDRDAELAGAENRVGIERRRYDESAAAYNATASGAVCSMFCGIAGVPCRAPLASEIDSFSR
ncbi:MAG: LemA family protein [Myxococcota bacterium]|nr:LemA family protein [Myxococcota bacterium]